MTNTETLHNSTIHPTLAGLPTSAFSVWDTDGIMFKVLATPSEAWQYLRAVEPYVGDNVSVIVEWVSAAALGGSFDLVTIKIANDEFRARGVAVALNEALTEVNSAG